MRPLWVAAALAVGVAAIPFAAMPAHAVTRVVPCDSNALTEAFTAANASPAPTTIDLTPGCHYTYSSGNVHRAALPLVKASVTVDGHGATIARGSGAAHAFRIIDVTDTGRLTLNDITVTGGDSNIPRSDPPSSGAGIDNDGVLILNRSTITGNSAGDGDGALYNQGTAVLSASTVSHNTARSGGGIYNTGDLIVIDSKIHDNAAAVAGGGLFSERGSTVLVRSEITGNTADRADASSGGGIFFRPRAAVTLDDTRVTGNSPDQCSPAIGSCR